MYISYGVITFFIPQNVDKQEITFEKKPKRIKFLNLNQIIYFRQ